MTLDEIILPGTEPEVLGAGYGFTEGPAADAEGNVYFSDGKHDSIYYWQVGRPPVLFTDQSPDAIGMMLNARGDLYVCEGAAYRIVAFDTRTKAKRVLCSEIDGQHFNEPNDLAIDFRNGFYFSDPNYQHHGQPTVMKQDVYYCSAEGVVTRVSTVCYKPNGVLLSADDQTLYVADARGQGHLPLRRGRAGPTGQRAAVDRQAGANPDGLTLDEHENLYICCGKAGLKIYDRQGQPVGRIDVHAANCCFGGRDFRTLCGRVGRQVSGHPHRGRGA